MRLSDRACAGSCDVHGSWTVTVEFLRQGPDVEDKCPLCDLEETGNALQEAWEQGYSVGVRDSDGDETL